MTDHNKEDEREKRTERERQRVSEKKRRYRSCIIYKTNSHETDLIKEKERGKEREKERGETRERKKIKEKM